MNTIYIRNWVLFNITSPIYSVVYKLMYKLACYTKVESVQVHAPRFWASTVRFTRGFTIYINEGRDHRYIQWFFIRCSCDAADVYHLYVVPMVRAHARRVMWRVLTLNGAWHTPLRIYHAYKHSFRSGRGVQSFRAYYKYHPYR